MIKLPTPRGRDARLFLLLALVSIGSMIAATAWTWHASHHLVEATAETEATTWARFLQQDLDDLNVILATGEISDKDRKTLQRAIEFGGVFRLKLYGPDGRVAFASRAADIGLYNTRPYFAEEVANGKLHIEIKDKNGDAWRGSYAETYVPVMDDGRFMGAIQAYVDTTATVAHFRRTFAVMSAILIGLMLLAAAAAGLVIFRNLDARSRDLDRLAEVRTEAARSRQRLEDAIEAISEAFVLYDADDRLVLCNSKHRELYPGLPHLLRPGATYEDQLRANVKAGLIPEAEGGNEDWIAKRLAVHLDPRGPFERELVNGRWLRINESKTRDGGIVGVRTDVTIHRLREEALTALSTELSDKNRQLDAALANMAQGLALFDADQRLQLCNTRYLDIYDVPEELGQSGTPLYDILKFSTARQGLDAEASAKVIESRLQLSRRSSNEVFDEHLSDGKIIRITHCAMPEGGSLATYEDITERTRAEEALRRNEASLAAAQRIARLGNWVWDEVEDRLIYSSDEMIGIFGVSRDAFPKTFDDCMEFIHPDDRERVKRVMTVAQENGAGYEVEYRIIDGQGNVRFVLENAEPVLDDGGNTIRTVGTSQDITEIRRAEEELRRSEESLANAQRIAHMGSWDWNVQTGEVRRSDEMFRLLGADPTEMGTDHKVFLDRVHPDDKALVDEVTDAMLNKGGGFSLQFRIVIPDGSIRVLDEQGEVTLDDAGTPILVEGTTQDITERVRAEDVQKGRNKVLERLASGASLEEVLTILVQATEYSNPGMLCSVLLLDKENNCLRHGAAPSLPKFYNDAIDGLEIGPNVGSCGASAYLGRRVIVEDAATHPNWVAFRELSEEAGLRASWSEPIFSPTGGISGTFAIYYREPRAPDDQDLETIATAAHLAGIAIDRKRVEDSLRASEELFRTIVDHSPTKIHIKDLDGRYLLVNRQAEILYDVTDEDVMGKTVDDVFPEGQARLLRAHDDAVLRSGKAIEAEEEFHLPDGNHTFLTVKFPIRDALGKVFAIGGIGTDFTERVRSREEIIAAKEQAELANRTKSEFLANMSHELRTPLNAIIGFSDLMKQQAFGPLGNGKYIDYACDINNSGAHLLQLINDILDLSKVEAGKLELYEEDVDVVRAIQSCLTLVKERADSGALNLVSEIPENLPMLRGDTRKVKQIVLNLLSNAVKFTPAGGNVTLRAAAGPKRGFVIKVIDSGIGISQEDKSKAMAAFGQVDSALTRKYEGTGLGLPLVKALVALHGGSFDLESEAGVGTTAIVRFPPDRIVDNRKRERRAAG